MYAANYERNVIHGNIICAITAEEPGYYLLVGYNGSDKPAWLNGVDDPNREIYMVVEARASFAKLLYTTEIVTYSLYNLSGGTAINPVATCMGLLKIGKQKNNLLNINDKYTV